MRERYKQEPEPGRLAGLVANSFVGLGREHSFVEEPGLNKKAQGPSRKEQVPSRKEPVLNKKVPGPNTMELVAHHSLIGVLERGTGERGENSWAGRSSVE